MLLASGSPFATQSRNDLVQSDLAVHSLYVSYTSTVGEYRTYPLGFTHTLGLAPTASALS